MAILQNVLAPSIVTGIVSRIYTPGSPLMYHFGMEIGGRNVDTVPGRSYSWDIFDNVRSIAVGRAPNTGPFTIAKNPVGRQTNTFPRSYEKIADLTYETLANIRQLGQNAGSRDRMGASYLEAQARIIKMRQNNFREFMVGSCLTQGLLYFLISGDDWIPTLSSAGTTWSIDYLIPAGNKSTAIAGLDPLGTGNIITASWATAGTKIVDHITAINLAFQQLVGAPLNLVITNSTVWNAVLNNTQVINMAGSANTPYAEYTMTEQTGPDGNKLGLMVGKIKAIPWLDWLIVDGGLEVNGTYTPWYDGTKATFMIQPNPYWFKMQEGMEPFKTSPMAPVQEGYGFTSWLREWDEPARVELHSLQNCIPELRIPKGIMCAKVIA